MEPKSPKQWIFFLIPVLIAALLIFLSAYPSWIETHYSNGLYPIISICLRSAFGLFPFSIGDILYAMAIIFLIRNTIRFFISLKNSDNRKKILSKTFIKSAQIIVSTYCLFNILWGLNYSRQGVKTTFHLQQQQISPNDLFFLANMLKDSVNANAALKTDSIPESQNITEIEKNAYNSYQAIERKFPFLSIKKTSFKKSLFGKLGNYMGYHGYYNPFTGESQINTNIPAFLIPFVSCHEIAHQVGFASESEANFVGFLAASHSENKTARYSAYLEMYLYASSQLRITDSVLAKSIARDLHPLAKNDIRQYINYMNKHRSILHDGINLFYDFYLKQNNQQKGIESYGEVTYWLVAYYKKQGIYK
jgi:hypothetical protein